MMLSRADAFYSLVMRGLDPRIHQLFEKSLRQMMDRRPGDEEL
jgi:hypothetical protein